MTATPAPWGSWTSPIDAARLAAGNPFYEQLLVTDGIVYWTRSDPSSGAVRLHRRSPDGTITVLAPEHNVRTRVHEYGGGAVAARGDLVVLSDYADQRLHRVSAGSSEPITPATGCRVRFAAGAITEDGRMVAVRETHGDAGVRNELVLVDLDDGTQTVLVDDHDFVAAPRLGPGGRLAWLAWDHPDMPWDGAAAHAGRLVDGRLDGARRVVGGDGVSVAELDWWESALVATSDESGFWEASLYRDGGVTRLTDDGVDLGKPHWNLGRSLLAVVGDSLVAVATDHAVDVLRVIRPDGTRRDLAGPAVAVQAVAADASHGVVTLEVDVDGRQAVRRHGLDGSIETLDEVHPITSRPGDLARPVPVTVDLPAARLADDVAGLESGDAGGDAVGVTRTHAFFHPPANADHVGPDDRPPPLVVFVHGGPTSHSPPVRSAAIAYWTTRGFAVVDVNHRGSSGHGRDYRRALWGGWGEVDVADVITVAEHLAGRGWVDGDRMAIRGGSAGGFTTLAVLTRPDHPFACGVSFFGVADLTALMRETHKFESRYLDRIIGPWPQARELMRERSPLSHVDDLRVPILVLQGLDDEVVAPGQSRAIVDAAAERGIPHAYLTFAGEGHGFRRPDTIVAWHEAELAFYGEVMGFTPAGDLPPVLDTAAG